MISRRGLITGLISLVAAPAIVRVASIMPVSAIDLWPYTEIVVPMPVGVVPGSEIYAELVRITREAFLPHYQARLWLEAPMVTMLKEMDHAR